MKFMRIVVPLLLAVQVVDRDRERVHAPRAAGALQDSGRSLGLAFTGLVQ